MEMVNLLPCPFCGWDVRFHGGREGDECNGCHHIWCDNCFVMVDLGTAADPRNDDISLNELRARIVPLWNRRIPVSAEGARNEP